MTMLYFATFVVALAMTMALVPPLIRFATKLQLMDLPSGRKVHATAIPRVGGIGMVLGSLLPILLWAPLEQELLSLLTGIGILFVFGVWDDRRNLDYRLKFLGQSLAAFVVIGYGGLEISVLPFFGLDPVSPWISRPFTFLTIIAVTNSINLADGLDGLAAGTMLLCLAGIALLAYVADGMNLLLVVLAVMGAVVGFLRFNTYPARIFMGDTGSQFLGFSVVTLLIMLTQKTNPALNPALPLLLIGVPLFDTSFVTIKRLYYGKSPFAADKNHVHHQLLALNLDHYEAVIIIYVVQALFVGCAFLLRYQSDLMVVASWILANAACAVILVSSGHAMWRAHKAGTRSRLASVMALGDNRYLQSASQAIIIGSVALLLCVGPVLAVSVDSDIGAVAAILLLLMLVHLVFGFHAWFVPLRLMMYVAVAFVLYLLLDVPADAYSLEGWLGYMYFGMLVGALVVGVRNKNIDAFQVTPMDFLLILMVVGLAFFPQARAGDGEIIHLIVQMFIMFYAIEFVIRKMTGRWNIATVSALWALGVIAVRGMYL